MTIKKEISELFNLAGKTAIVTGGAKGIGVGITIRLAQAGANVVVCDLDETTLNQTVCKLSDERLNVVGISGDVSVEDDCVKAIKKAVDTYGGVDILVNNAAFYPTKPFIETTQLEWDKVFAVNCRGAFLMAREAAKIMLAQNQITHSRGGSLIFISSLGAYRTNRVGMSAYHSSKGAIISLKNEMASELTIHNIRTNCISPGAINSSRLNNKGEYDGHAMPVNMVPLGRIGVPYDIANAVLYLASPAAEFISGIDLVVDGGMYKTPTFGYPSE